MRNYVLALLTMFALGLACGLLTPRHDPWVYPIEISHPLIVDPFGHYPDDPEPAWLRI
jgi:hypothetical protein